MRWLVACLVAGAALGMVVAAGCFRIIERDANRCNAEVPDCPSNSVCYEGRCLDLDAPLPDGFVPGLVCTSSRDCIIDSAPACEGKQCRACAGDAEDEECKVRDSAQPRCESSGRCVACRAKTQDQDCPKEAPICEGGGSCKKCETHAECAGGMCKPDGQCAPLGEVAYVDNRGMAPSVCAQTAGPHDGYSPATAFCDIQDAVAATTKTIIQVTGHAGAPYGAVVVDAATLNKSLTVVGPGRDVGDPAYIYDATKTGFTIRGSSVATDVVLDGIEIGDRTLATKGYGVYCYNGGPATASLTIKQSAIQGAGYGGVSTSGCSLTMVGSSVTGNAGGIDVRTSVGTPYTLVNNLIVDNRRDLASMGGGGVVPLRGPGVRLDGPSSGVFAFNTVARNMAYVGAGGGINCGQAIARSIQSSIVWGNEAANGSQFADTGGPQNCVVLNVVTGADTVMGAIQKTPEFVESATQPFNFRLRPGGAANLDCCIDRANSGATPFADRDVDGRGRPQGGGSDIGAHEVQ